MAASSWRATNCIDIREHKDASEDERAITLCNGGLMALRGDVALAILEKIGKDNAKGEYYLTDAVALARAGRITAPPSWWCRRRRCMA